MKETIKAINSIEFDLDNVIEVLSISNIDTCWEFEIDERISLIWNDRTKEIELSTYHHKAGESRFKLERLAEYNNYLIPVGLDIEDCITVPLDEFVVRNKSVELRSYESNLDENGRWEIECGDEGWMNYSAELGCYIIGQYGAIYPFTKLNELEGYTDQPGKLVQTDDGYKIVKV